MVLAPNGRSYRLALDLAEKGHWPCHGTPSICPHVRRLSSFTGPKWRECPGGSPADQRRGISLPSLHDVVLNVLKDEDVWEVRIEEDVMGRARPATNIWYCVENGITDTSKKKNRPSLYGNYYFVSLCKAKTRSLAKYQYIVAHQPHSSGVCLLRVYACYRFVSVLMNIGISYLVQKPRINAFPSQSFPCLSIRKHPRSPNRPTNLPTTLPLLFPGSNKRNARRRRSAIRLACLNAQRGRT